MGSDVTSVTFASWASNITKCSNPVFDRVLQRSWTDKSLQKDTLTVLTAVTDIIKANNGTESATEYYASLLTLLNIESTTKAAEAYLLKVVMSRAIPDTLLQATFSEAAKILVHLLVSCYSSDKENITLLKSLISCLGSLLCAQPAESWSVESVRHIYRHLLRFIDHSKPTIRKASHVAVYGILSAQLGDSSTLLFHPACHQTVDQLCSSLRQEARKLVAVLQTKDAHCTRLLHCLELLTTILHVLPHKEVKIACECILELVDFPNQLVVGKAFYSIRALFQSHPSLTALPVEMAARLITALHTYRPHDPAIVNVQSDTKSLKFTGLDVLLAWAHAVRAGCAHLCALNNGNDGDDLMLTNPNETITVQVHMGIQRMAMEHVDKLMKTLFELLYTTPLPTLRSAVTEMLDDILMNELSAQLLTDDTRAQVLPVLLSLVSKLDSCFNLQHYETWTHALALTARLLRLWYHFSHANPASVGLDPSFCALLRRIAQLRDSLIDGPSSLANLIQMNAGVGQSLTPLSDQLGEAIIDELDRVCLVALESLGPEVVLGDELLPLDSLVDELKSGSLELRRSWLLPILARARPTQPCRLAFFYQSLIPLADKSLSALPRLAATTSIAQQQRNALITAAITMTKQIWAGLSMFVRKPPLDWTALSSIGTSEGLGRRLVKELTYTPALRSIVLYALRRLAMAAQSEAEADDSQSAGQKAMRGGAKLVIPAMLSLFESTEDLSLQQQLREALAAYLPCLSNKMISTPTKLALQKLSNTQNPIYLELLQMLVPHLPSAEIRAILGKLKPYLLSSTSSRVLQKRTYRLISLICAATTPSCRAFVDEHLDDLLHLMHDLTSGEGAEHLTDPNIFPSDISLMDTAEIIKPEEKAKKLKEKKGKKALFVPWKPRLRCLLNLLRFAAEKEEEGKDEEELKVESMGSMENPRLRSFANMFLPEILAALCESNGMVRDLAGRLLTTLTLAFAGQPLVMPHEEANERLNRARSGARSTQSQFTANDDSDGEEGDKDAYLGDEVENLNLIDGATSIGGFTCVDEDDMLSTKSMARGSEASFSICAALHLLLTRLWNFLPPQIPPATNPAELATQQSAGRAVCHLLTLPRFRRALAFCVDSDSDLAHGQVGDIVSAAGRVATQLVASDQRAMAQLGLRLVRLSMLFINLGMISLIDLVTAVQSLHKSQKLPLRFAVKSILEKMITKFGRNTLQGMTTPEYMKVVRNSARTMARRDRHKAAQLHTIRETDEDALSTLTKSVRSVALGDGKSESGRSHLSLPSRVHTPRFDELLAASSDEEDLTSRRSKGAPSVASSKRSRKSTAQSTASKPKSLVEELESVAETTGLCRRSRKSIISHGDNDDSDGEGDRHTIAFGTERVGIRRKVRFADSASVASAGHLTSMRSRIKSKSTASIRDLWLVEKPDTDDILDLSDPKALARHTAIATSAEAAEAMTRAFRRPSRSGESAKSEEFSFPVVDGKFVIENPSKNSTSVSPAKGDWDMQFSDEDDEADVQRPHGWSNPEQQKARKLIKTHANMHIPGQVYSSTKAAGDMRRAGKPDPYAFVSLGEGLGGLAGRMGSKLERRRLLRAVGMGKRNRTKSASLGVSKSKGGVVRQRLKRERK